MAIPIAAALLLAAGAPPAWPQARDPYANLERTHIRYEDLPPPASLSFAANPPRVVRQPRGARLHAPPGFRIVQAAGDFDTPRNMALAPSGEVFLAESGAGRIVVLRDRDGDGRFESRGVFADSLEEPFGLAFAPGYLYVGTEGAVLRYRYRPGQARAESPPEMLVELPTGGHWTRDVLHDEKSGRVYVSVGSRGNRGEEAFPRASVFWFDPRERPPEPRPFATGLRNPVSLAREPVTGAIWAVVNEMDGLGEELPPDWATAIVPGAFYGWPYGYAGNHPVPGLPERHRARVRAARRPDVLLRPHSAPLDIVFYTGRAFPGHFRGGAFVALHGSWNAKGRRGYEVVFLPFRNGKAAGWSERFLWGWSQSPSRREVWGRPVGLLVDRDGSLLVTEDGNGTIWRVSYAGGGR
jgi:glucose/arabinose dehydrogenase